MERAEVTEPRAEVERLQLELDKTILIAKNLNWKRSYIIVA